MDFYFVCNTQGNQIEIIYYFEEDEKPKIFHLDDNKRITHSIKLQMKIILLLKM